MQELKDVEELRENVIPQLLLALNSISKFTENYAENLLSDFLVFVGAFEYFKMRNLDFDLSDTTEIVHLVEISILILFCGFRKKNNVFFDAYKQLSENEQQVFDKLRQNLEHVNDGQQFKSWQLQELSLDLIKPDFALLSIKASGINQLEKTERLITDLKQELCVEEKYVAKFLDAKSDLTCELESLQLEQGKIFLLIKCKFLYIFL
jgi:hypothetical protein